MGRTQLSRVFRSVFFISTHSPRVGRTTLILRVVTAVRLISTHSPRVGRTLRHGFDLFPGKNFNSLAPCGANLNGSSALSWISRFQLTRPVWGEPLFVFVTSTGLGFQLTRPVWGEPSSSLIASIASVISTHSPRVGRTFALPDFGIPLADFNSLAPCGANPGT